MLGLLKSHLGEDDREPPVAEVAGDVGAPDRRANAPADRPEEAECAGCFARRDAEKEEGETPLVASRAGDLLDEAIGEIAGVLDAGHRVDVGQPACLLEPARPSSGAAKADASASSS